MSCRRGRHLRLLHMALPALVAGAVEAGLVAKEALSRRRRGGTPAGFTDDGFPLGVAFLLKVVAPRETCSNSRARCIDVTRRFWDRVHC